MIQGNFSDYPLQIRRKLYSQAIVNHPNDIAIIIQSHPKSKITKNCHFKFMAKKIFNIAMIRQIIRRSFAKTTKDKEGRTDSLQAIFIFCKSKILIDSIKLEELQDKKDKQDNFLYLTMAQTQTF